MAQVRELRCRECDRMYAVAPIHVCEFCFGPLEPVYDYDAIAASVTRAGIEAGPRTVWRYSPLLPIGDGVDANADLFGSADYRTHMAQVYTARALTQALSRAA